MNFVKAFSAFVSTVIGVGIFSLPFLAMRAGFLTVFIYFILMAFVVGVMHFIYAEVIAETEKPCRFPGYVGEYLGANWKKAGFLIIITGCIGASLAYILIGGHFLFSILGQHLGGSEIIYCLIFFILASFFVFRGVVAVSRAELFLSICFLGVLGVLLFKLFPLVNFNNLLPVNLNYFFLPYGAVLFSLWGSNILPELKDILALLSRKDFLNNKQKPRIYPADIKKVILIGIIFCVAVYILFSLAVLGASGGKTSEDAISGISIVGKAVLTLGFLMGILTCFSSLISILLTLKKTFMFDFKIPRHVSWLTASVLPLIFLFLGVNKFLNVISFTGAIGLGLEGILTIFLYKAFLKKRFSLKINPAFYLLVGVFAVGIVLEIIYYL